MDLTEMDVRLIKQAENICKIFKSNHIYFCHIERELSLPRIIVENYPQFRQPLDEQFEAEMKKTVEKHFSPERKISIHYDIGEGSPNRELVHRTEIKNIDLLIMGKKTHSGSLGITVQKVLNSCPCSVLVIHEQFKGEMKKVLVSSDYKENSIEALHVAAKIVESNELSELKVVNVYDQPKYDSGAIMTQAQLTELIEKGCQEDFHVMLGKAKLANLNAEAVCLLNINYMGAELVTAYANSKEFDLLVAGSAGKTGIKRLFLGSFSEKLADKFRNHALLIIK